MKQLIILLLAILLVLPMIQATTYTTDSIWAKPSGLTYVIVETVGGGGGGGVSLFCGAGGDDFGADCRYPYPVGDFAPARIFGRCQCRALDPVSRGFGWCTPKDFTIASHVALRAPGNREHVYHRSV